MMQDFAFQAAQRQFAGCIRDPDRHLPPQGVDARRMKIYQELFFNNVEGFLSNGFPVLRSLYVDKAWKQLVRIFLASHACQTPYFNEIGQEFINFLQTKYIAQPEDPPFLLELAHYEWIELALAISELTLSEDAIDSEGDLLQGVPVLSPLAWVLSYYFPVHLIDADYQPREPGDSPACLVLYRQPDFSVHYLEINEIIFHYLEAIRANTTWTGQQVFQHFAQITGQDVKLLQQQGIPALELLREKGIILGVQLQ